MNDEVIMIPIAEIHILNPRHRDQKKFEVIVNSIKTLGLKMPITVSLRAENEPAGLKYDLVCGQGRMEAFIALGHLEIPAIVVEITKEERLIRSLVENIARRYPATMDLIREIERLRADGYVNRNYGGNYDHGNAWKSDMQADFNLSRMWYFTGNTNYNQKGQDILLAWANTMTNFNGVESAFASKNVKAVEMSKLKSSDAKALEPMK